MPQNGWFIMDNPIKMDDLDPPYQEKSLRAEMLMRYFGEATTWRMELEGIYYCVCIFLRGRKQMVQDDIPRKQCVSPASMGKGNKARICQQGSTRFPPFGTVVSIAYFLELFHVLPSSLLHQQNFGHSPERQGETKRGNVILCNCFQQDPLVYPMAKDGED